jgi:hypothetical protein
MGNPRARYGLLAVAILLVLLALTLIPRNTRPTYARYFGGYECTKACQTHAIGFAWARARGVTDPDDCRGPSRSFVEGCRAYLRDRLRDFTKDDAGKPVG